MFTIEDGLSRTLSPLFPIFVLTFFSTVQPPKKIKEGEGELVSWYAPLPSVARPLLSNCDTWNVMCPKQILLTHTLSLSLSLSLWSLLANHILILYAIHHSFS